MPPEKTEDEEPATDDSPSKPPEGRRLSFVEMAKKVRSKVAIAALAMPKSKKSAPFGASKDQSGAGIAGAASMASMIKSKLLGEEDDDDDDDDDEKKEEADSGDEIVVDQGEGSEGEPAKQSNKEVTLDDIRKMKAKMRSVSQIMIQGEDVEIGSDSDVSDTSQIS